MLRLVALVSGIYDAGIGLSMLLATDWLASTFGVAPPSPRVLADTNGLFALSVGIGYFCAARNLAAWRPYLWLMGPFTKGLGALAFLHDYLIRGGAPSSFLLFAVADGTLALWTLGALVSSRRGADSAV